MAKTRRGKWLSRTLFPPLLVSNWSLHPMSCFLSELEQSVELSRKDCQLLKEENLCRQKELKQVKTWIQRSDFHLEVHPSYLCCIFGITLLNNRPCLFKCH